MLVVGIVPGVNPVYANTFVSTGKKNWAAAISVGNPEPTMAILMPWHGSEVMSGNVIVWAMGLSIKIKVLRTTMKKILLMAKIRLMVCFQNQSYKGRLRKINVI